MSGAELCMARSIAMNLKAGVVPAPAAVPQFPLWARGCLGATGDRGRDRGRDRGAGGAAREIFPLFWGVLWELCGV